MPELVKTDPTRYEKTTMSFQLTLALKEALDTFSTKAGKDVAAVIRESIASHIGYDLSIEPVVKRGKPSKYATEAERKAAEKARRDEQNALKKKLLDEYYRKQKEEAAKALRDSLERKGIKA